MIERRIHENSGGGCRADGRCAEEQSRLTQGQGIRPLPDISRFAEPLDVIARQQVANAIGVVAVVAYRVAIIDESWSGSTFHLR